MPVFIVEMPLPPRGVSSNARGHTRTMAPIVAAWRQTAAFCYQRAGVPILQTKESSAPIVIDLDFYTSARYVRGHKISDNCLRPKDQDGARRAFKAAQDALIDCGLVPDDNDRYVTMGHTRLHKTFEQHQGKCGIVVTITAPDLPETALLIPAKVERFVPVALVRAKYKQFKRRSR